MWPFVKTDKQDEQEAQTEVGDIVPSLRLDMDDAELLRVTDKFLEIGEGRLEKLRPVWEKSKRYALGEQLDKMKLHEGRSDIVDNRIFLSMETVIPIMTSRTPEPTVRLADARLRENVKQMLMFGWEYPSDNDDDRTQMQAQLELLSRHWHIYRFGMLQYWWDEEALSVSAAAIHPSRLLLDDAPSVGESRFVGKKVTKTVAEAVRAFPKAKTDIYKTAAGIEDENTKITWTEFWTDDYVCSRFKNVILEKKKNPNWDYGDLNPTGKPLYNLFKKRQKPFIPLSVFNYGTTIADETSLIEQAIPLQDSVNKRKRQISDNADDNGTLIGSNEQIDKKILERYRGLPQEKLYVSGDARSAVVRLSPKDLQPFVFQDLQHSINELDNLFGTHSTTRGETGAAETATGRQLLRQGDMGRIDLLSRGLDRVAQAYYKAFLHLHFVFCTEPKEIGSNDDDGTPIIFNREEYLNRTKDGIASILIKVKSGSAMSIDKDARAKEAMELSRGKLIDPITLFERLDYPNPKELAERLYRWTAEPTSLFPDIEAEKKQEELSKAVNSPIPEGTPINLPPGVGGAGTPISAPAA